MSQEIEELRLRYKPSVVRVLFLGESPPAGGTFFYSADSNLCKYTKRAFEHVYHQEFLNQVFLSLFRDLGCYLDDLCSHPINHLDRGMRAAARTGGIAALAGRLEVLNPWAVVCVMKAIQSQVWTAVSTAGLNPLWYLLPFPSNGNQIKYVDELTRVLSDLRTKGLLPDSLAIRNSHRVSVGRADGVKTRAYRGLS